MWQQKMKPTILERRQEAYREGARRTPEGPGCSPCVFAGIQSDWKKGVLTSRPVCFQIR